MVLFLLMELNGRLKVACVLLTHVGLIAGTAALFFVRDRNTKIGLAYGHWGEVYAHGMHRFSSKDQSTHPICLSKFHTKE